jgi:Tfp pilus assembly protein PilX
MLHFGNVSHGPCLDYARSLEGRRVRSSQGFALIVVAWFLVLSAAIATYMMANARTETAIARNVVAAASAEALADAAIAQTIFNQNNGVESKGRSAEGAWPFSFTRGSRG